jgi:hypothetical protein
VSNKIISDRCLNNLLKPVVNRNRNITFPFGYQINNYGEDVPVTISGSWNSLCHFTLDLIATEIYHHHYGTKIIRSWKNIDQLHPKIALMNKDTVDMIFKSYDVNNKEPIEVPGNLFYQIGIDLNKIYSQYRHIYIRKGRLIESIKKIANTLFTFIYSFRLNYVFIDTYLTKSGERKDKKPQPVKIPRVDLNINIPSRLFFLESIDDSQATLKIGSPLSILFTHNILSLNTDWIDDSIGRLSDNASFIYRKFLSYRKNMEVELSLIYQLLGYDNPNNMYRYKGWVEKALDELVEFGFIKKASIGKFNRIRKTNLITFER